MASPHLLNDTSYERNTHDRQLGWMRFWVLASVAERSPAKFVSRVVTWSGAIPRLARAWFTHFTMRPSMYEAVDAAAGAGCAAGPTAKPRKAISAAASSKPGRAGRVGRVVSADMARIVTGTSSFENPNERPVRTYRVASWQRSRENQSITRSGRSHARGSPGPARAALLARAPPRPPPRTGST